MTSLLDITEVNPTIRDCISADQAWHYRIIPISKEENVVCFASNQTEKFTELEEELAFILGVSVSLEQAHKEQIDRLLSTSYRRAKKSQPKLDLSSENASNVIRSLIEEADGLGSSDIHIENYEETARIRIRIDGALVERYRYASERHTSIVNRVKIQSALDISEKRLPQDGRMQIGEGKNTTDVRVSILPTLHGEKVVLRILGKDAAHLDIEQVGMNRSDLRAYLNAVRKPHGIVLISGPTGSGKTTTLYATLKFLNDAQRNIVTVENPVEYTLEGINQVQTKEAIGFSFAKALKSFLRQDPDVIMLGEIRDSETAQMAIRAALTGHLVLSTIHTNSAWGTINRLKDMGIAPFLISSTLNASVAQRLVRKLCLVCRNKTQDSSRGPFQAEGCPACHYTGYQGRTAIYEVIRIDKKGKQLIENSVSDNQRAESELGYQTLKSQAEELYKNGTTSLEEVFPIIGHS